MLKSLVGKVLAAKLIAAGASVLAVGGVAYAATTGHLPDPLPHSSHAAPVAASHVPTARPTPATPSKAGPTSHVSPTHHARGAVPTHPAASPSPGLVGLCRAWLARPSDAGAADQTPAAAALVAAAGGRASVTSYCTTLLATTQASQHPTGKPTATPKDPSPGHRAGKPTHAPTHSAHPTGKPTAPGHH